MHSGLGENQLNRADLTNKMRYSRTVLIGNMTSEPLRSVVILR